MPGFLGIFASSRNPVAAKAVADVLFSQKGQAVIVHLGDMHAVDPRLKGPQGRPGVELLLRNSLRWTPELLSQGDLDGVKLKTTFSGAFAQ